MRALLFAACVFVAAGLVPADDRINLVDRGVGLYARYVHCELNRRPCEAWSPPEHLPAQLLRSMHPDETKWRAEVAQGWTRFGVPRWFIDTIG